MVPVQTGSETVSGNMGMPRPGTKRSGVFEKSQTGTGTAEFGPVQTGFQSVWDRTSPTLLLSVPWPSELDLVIQVSPPWLSTVPTHDNADLDTGCSLVGTMAI